MERRKSLKRGGKRAMTRQHMKGGIKDYEKRKSLDIEEEEEE